MCCQYFADLYYIYFPQDPRLLKTVVYLVYVTETVYTILISYDLGNIMFSFKSDYDTLFLFPILTPVCGAIGTSQLTPGFRLRIIS